MPDLRGVLMSPELSVIIPTLDEAAALPRLFADLAAQTGVTLEVVVSDGGSTDGTARVAAGLLSRHRLAGCVITGPCGRGRQLNRGAASAIGEWLLFLHADSRLPAASALADGLSTLRRGRNLRLAGRFALRFDAAAGTDGYGCYFCEVKARLGLPGTIHGDQGFLLTRAFFDELGGFREDLPALEDTLLAERVRAVGAWQLLPATIVTSARRFETEGFRRRQTLNALLMNCAMIGWDEPLRRFADAYRPQGRTRLLQLAPFFRLIDGCLDELPLPERLRIWYRTGSYVRSNAWQLQLRQAARRSFAAGLPPTAVPVAAMLRLRRRFDALTDHVPGRLAAALLTWLWFQTRRRTSAGGE